MRNVAAWHTHGKHCVCAVKVSFGKRQNGAHHGSFCFQLHDVLAKELEAHELLSPSLAQSLAESPTARILYYVHSNTPLTWVSDVVFRYR